MNKKEGMNLRWWNVFCTEKTRGRHEQSKETDGKGKNKRLQKCVSEWENQGDGGINSRHSLFYFFPKEVDNLQFTVCFLGTSSKTSLLVI